MREFRINHSSFSDISDDQLRDIVNTIKEHHPRAGEVMVQGHLRAQGVHVQRERLRSAIRQVDPVGAASRRRPPFDGGCILSHVQIIYGTSTETIS